MGGADRLGGYHPSHVCFVAKPLDAPASFVETVHQLMRALDGDPYGDGVWGVITGYDAEDALRVASGPSSMTISNVILNCWYSAVLQIRSFLA